MGVKMFEARYGAGIINLKKYKDEIVYAIASLGRIGTADDIPALEKFLEVRIQDMRIAAEFAIGRIKVRGM